MHAGLAPVAHAITAVKAGDPTALHYLYVRYADVVCAYVSSIVGEYGDAEDITQAVFLKLPRAVAAYESGGLPFEGWLLRVARSSALDVLRRQPEMSPEQRELLALRHIAGLTPAEIAGRLDPPARHDPPVSLA